MNAIGNKKIISVIDYKNGVDGFPKSDVIKYELENQCSVVIRPSGTEPKIKVYISIIDDSRSAANVTENYILDELKKFLV